MFRRVVLFVCLAAFPIFGANVQLLASLPAGSVSNAMQLDAAGNIYIAGSFPLAARPEVAGGFVAKLSPDGSKVTYFTALAGTSSAAATALALGTDGSVYVTGFTNSADFPVTAGALQPTYSGGRQSQGFLVKVNPAGAVAYSTFINGNATTQVTGIALDSAGEVFLTAAAAQAILRAARTHPKAFF